MMSDQQIVNSFRNVGSHFCQVHHGVCDVPRDPTTTSNMEFHVHLPYDIFDRNRDESPEDALYAVKVISIWGSEIIVTRVDGKSTSNYFDEGWCWNNQNKADAELIPLFIKEALQFGRFMDQKDFEKAKQHVWGKQH